MRARNGHSRLWLAVIGLLLCILGPADVTAQTIEEPATLFADPELEGLRREAQAASLRGEFSTATARVNQILRIVSGRGANGSRDHVTALGLRARFHREGGQLRLAEADFRSVCALLEASLGARHAVTLTCLNNRAAALMRLGRLDEAEDVYRQAFQFAGEASGDQRLITAVILSNLGQNLGQQGRAAEAEQLFRRALQLVVETSGGDSAAAARLADNLATNLMVQGRFAEAQTFLSQSGDIYERLYGLNSHGMRGYLLNQAGLESAQGRHATAERIYRAVMPGFIASVGEHHPDLAFPLVGFAHALGMLDRRNEAEPILERALQIHTQTYGDQHLGTRVVAAELALNRLEQPNRRHLALNPARLAAGNPDTMATARGIFRQEVQAQRDLSRYGELHALLAAAAWAAANADRDESAERREEAYQALQRAAFGPAGTAVVQMAVRRRADEAGGQLGNLARERVELSERWAMNSAEQSAALAGSGAESEAWRQELRAEAARIEARVAEIDVALRTRFPDYFTLIRPEPLGLAATQEMLGQDEAILLTVPTRVGTQVFGISRSRVAWVQSPWTRDQVDAAVRRLLFDVGANVEVSAEQAAQWRAQDRRCHSSYDRGTAFALYQQLVAPVADILEGKRQVFVATAGSLTSLPFAMLVTAPPQGRDDDPAALRETRWFADAHALVQIPSIQSLRFLRGLAPPSGDARSTFLGFGNPTLGAPVRRGADCNQRGMAIASPLERDRTRTTGAVANVRLLRRAPSLPGTAEELENVRAALGAPRDSLFMAERATESNFRSTDLSRARILVLSTHGVLAGEVTEIAEPGLIFTPPASASEQDDGFLTMSEATTLRLDADWVILSACNTAAGDGSNGAPGLSGLARAFFYAGARNLLASHWPVLDDVSARLIVRTIQLTRERPDLRRSESLQLAMREIRNNSEQDATGESWAHPRAWAPFTLIGGGDSTASRGTAANQ